MYKIIIRFKENTLEILTFIVILGLIIAATQASAADNGNLSKMMVCREVEQGRYEHMEKLLKPNSTLREVKLNSSGAPIYTGIQIIELAEITTKCGLQAIPFLELMTEAVENLENSYTKFFNS